MTSGGPPFDVEPGEQYDDMEGCRTGLTLCLASVVVVLLLCCAGAYVAFR